jgi:signal recognition particle receptor subunit beta
MVQDVFSLLRPSEGRRRKASFAGLSSLLVTSETPVSRNDPAGIELRHLIDALARCGRELQTVLDPVLSSHIKEMLDHIGAIAGRIAVVGQVKAGKSSFINALIQRANLLPTHVNPWTAVATKLHFGAPGKPVTGCDFTFFSAEEWAGLGQTANGETSADPDAGFAEMKTRAETRLGEQFHHLLGKAHFYQSVQSGVLEHYLCAGPPVGEVSRQVKPGRYADITKTANLYFPLPPWAVPATLVDTPGTNDSTHLRFRITRETIEGADIYIVVLTARQPLASSDLGLLKLLRGLDKQRIIVFINRIDELSERAGATDVVVRHVKDELERVFEGASIPIVAGSAKWAGLANGDNLALLRAEARMPAFEAVAARKALAVPAADADGELTALQGCFRAASGVDAVNRLLSLFLLSGFVANHARGAAGVLLATARKSTADAGKELRAVDGFLRGLPGDQTGPQGAAALAEIASLLAAIEDRVTSLAREAGASVDDGIARLESALEADIRALSEPARQSSGAARSGKVSGSWGFETQAPQGRPAQATRPIGVERSDWLASVKEATFGLLRKALAEAPPAPEPEAKPAAARRTSLTVPVNATASDVSMDSGVSWWSEWMTKESPDARSDDDLHQIVVQGFAPSAGNAGSREREILREFSEHSAKDFGLISIAPLTRLATIFHEWQAEEAAAGDEQAARLAQILEECGKAVNEACLAIAIHERITRQVRALFTPPRPTG